MLCRDTVNTLDLRQPFRWYPVARSLKRKFIYHSGPTNSGKTYTALQVGSYCKMHTTADRLKSLDIRKHYCIPVSRCRSQALHMIYGVDLEWGSLLTKV